MGKKYSFIIVGTGGMGKRWCRLTLPPLIQAGRITPAAAVDVSPEALQNAQEFLGLSPAQCYTSMDEAFDKVRADFAIIVTPPALHERVVDLALQHDLDILSEKPIADTMDASVRVLKKVQRAGKRMGVTMSHRYDADKVTFREILKAGRLGRLDYIVTRFACANRKFGDWGVFRYQIPDPLLIEGSVHHLDILRSFAADDCAQLYARTWNPPWGEFAGDSCALVTLDMVHGVKCFYEGAKTNAYTLNCWEDEYFRAECEFGTLILDCRRIQLLVQGQEPEEIPLAERPNWKNEWLAEQFVDWLDGGAPMQTRVEDNIQASALVFGAIESSTSGQPINIQKYLQEKLATVELSACDLSQLEQVLCLGASRNLMPRSNRRGLPNRATIKDVARKARVSPSTVSRVMSGSRRVNPAIEQHVKRVAESLQYHPNRLAHSLRKTSPFAVGLLVLDITNPFCAQIARSAQQVLDAAGYLTILCDGERNPARELEHLPALMEARVAGLIINSVADDPTEFEKYCQQHHLPGILVDRHRSAVLDSVRGDNYSGTLQAIAHLASRGYRRIAIFAGRQTALSGYERLDAYRRAVRLYNLESNEDLIQVGDFTETSGYQLTRKLLEMNPPPQAIFASNNTIGFGVFRALRDCSVHIPEEMALLIFDDFALADLTAPPLTVIAQPIAEIGQTAAHLLLRRLQGKDHLEVQEILLQPKLILRGSV